MHDGQGAQRRAAQGDGGRPQGPHHGRGRRQARRRLPDHRRPAEGLRRGPRHRHPAGRVRRSSAPRSAWPSAATGRSARSSSTASSSPASTRSSARSPSSTTARPAWCKMPITIRIPFGGGIGAVEHHSESPEAYFAHTAGLKVVSCSNPSDAYWMIQQAIADDDPVVFFEPKRRYWAKAEIDDRADAAATRPGSCARAGTSPSSPTARRSSTALEAATVAAEDGIELEVIDLRSVSPLDMPTVLDSVRRTGRLIVVHEAPHSFGVGAEIAARVRSRRSTPSRRRCCGSPATTPRTRRAASSTSGCPTSTASSTPSTARWSTEAMPDASMIKQFQLPDLGEGLTEGDILKWTVAVGDTVEVNDTIAEVETVKAAVELPSPFAGVSPRCTPPRARPCRSARRSSRSTSARAAADGRCRPNRRVEDLVPGLPGEGAGPAGGEAADPRRLRARASRPAAGAAAAAPRPAVAAEARRRRSTVAARPGRTDRRTSRSPPPRPAPSRVLAKPPVRKLAKSLGVDLTTVAPDRPERHGLARRRPARPPIRSRSPPTRSTRRAAAGRPSARPGSRSRASASTPRRPWSLERVHRAARHRVRHLRRHGDDGAARPGRRAARVPRRQGLAAAVRRQGGAPRRAAHPGDQLDLGRGGRRDRAQALRQPRHRRGHRPRPDRAEHQGRRPALAARAGPRDRPR